MGYCSTSRVDRQDYDKVKKEILYQLDITPEKHQPMFWIRKKEDRSPRVLLQNLADIMERWLKLTITSKEKICDQIHLERFLSDLEENTQKWVKCYCLKKSAEALQLAEHFDSGQGELPQDRGLGGGGTTSL